MSFSGQQPSFLLRSILVVWICFESIMFSARSCIHSY